MVIQFNVLDCKVSMRLRAMIVNLQLPTTLCNSNILNPQKKQQLKLSNKKKIIFNMN